MSELSKLQHSVERRFKKWLGNHDDDLRAISEKIQEIVEREAVELLKSGVDKAWDAIQGISVGEIKITREMYDVIVRALTDSIIELGGDK